MNKEELVRVVAADAEMTVKDAEKAVTATLTAMKGALAAGDEVRLTEFGTWSVKYVPARTANKPGTREPMRLAETWQVTFKRSKALKEAVHNGGKSRFAGGTR